MRLLRSYLFAPGNYERLLGRVFAAGSDAVVLDLEDAVPEAEKGLARALVAETLKQHRALVGSASPSVFVRINDLESAHWRLDVDAVVMPGVLGLRVPKVEGVESLCRLNDALARREEAAGMPIGSVQVVATIESARGVALVESLARAPRLEGLTFGAADFCADIGADGSDDQSTLFARSRLVMASRHLRLAPPIASVFTNLDDDDGLLADTKRQKRVGFFGRSAIHPRQLPIIHAAFNPTDEEVEGARKTILAYEVACRAGRGATRAGGDFVDLAVVRRARAAIALHEVIGREAARKDEE